MKADVTIPLASHAPAGAPAERDEIVRAQQGDRAACHALILRHQRAVGSLLRRMLAGSDLDALTEDLAQETFLRAFAALRRFDPDGPARLSTWLLTIATRLALQALARRRLPATAFDDDAGDAHVEADELAPDRARIGSAIAEAMKRLAPPYRAAFVLREYHGFDYAEIARSLDIDIGTVKSRLWRARAALQRALGDVNDD
jgi:RNA polymerase sigma-70 factor (ECF subfamily)